MALHNPNNWHWVNKDTKPWAREYLDKTLIGTSAEDNGVTAQIDKVLSMDGDVDVSQRKGKVITLFDVRLQLEYSGTTHDADDVSGRITIPEVAHDTEEDEYVFEIDVYNDAPSKQPVKDLVRSQLTPQLRAKLATLAPQLIETHGKDIQHAASAGGDARASSFRAATVYQSSGLNKSSSSTPATDASSVNVTTVTDTDEFRCPAAELFKTFTDPQRIAAFTREPPKRWDGAQPGAAFEIFGGNVQGEFVALTEPTLVVQKWRLRQWPAGHFSRLEMSFDQNDVDAVTVMRVQWTGVPVGQEEVTKKNWREYYVGSIKRAFGFGTVL